mgnify:CR=1 FL=1
MQQEEEKDRPLTSLRERNSENSSHIENQDETGIKDNAKVTFSQRSESQLR